MSKTTLILRIVGTVSHLCWNQMPSNLHFRFSSSCIGHLNKTQMEMAVMLTFPVFENLDWKENNVESFKDFGQPTTKWQSFKFFLKLHRNSLLFTNNFQYHESQTYF